MKGLVIRRLGVSRSLQRLLIGIILTGCLSTIFWVFFIQCMHCIFIFYATMVNILVGFYTPQKLFTWGLGFYNVVMQFLFSFLKAMRMQKSKYAKMEIIYTVCKNKNTTHALYQKTQKIVERHPIKIMPIKYLCKERLTPRRLITNPFILIRSTSFCCSY